MSDLSLANAEPLGRRILVKRYDPKKTAGEDGEIVLADIAVKQNAWAKVIKVGPDVTTISPGDSVVVSLYGGTEIEFGRENYLVIDEEELLVKVPGDDGNDPA